MRLVSNVRRVFDTFTTSILVSFLGVFSHITTAISRAPRIGSPLFTIFKVQLCMHSGWIQDLVKGAPIIFLQFLPTLTRRVMQTKWALIGDGSGITSEPRKVLVFSLLNMHSIHFEVPFYTIFKIIKYKYFLINCPEKILCTYHMRQFHLVGKFHVFRLY